MHSHHFVACASRVPRGTADGDEMGAPDRDDGGAILVEYGMVLVAVLLLSIALVQFIGGRVVEMFRGVLPGLG
jgi:Flp pilus assembly pilin Flp